MGLDMRPMGKPKPGFEKRFEEVFIMVTQNKIPKRKLIDKLKGKKQQTKEALLQEWRANQIPSYEALKAPRVGRDKEADNWIRSRYDELEQKPLLESFLKEYEGYYVIELAKELDGVPVYIAMGQDENVFRGEFLRNCVDILGEDLAYQAWSSKFATETLDYGNKLMVTADRLAEENGLKHLKEQRLPPDADEDTMESKLHIVYSLARWLIFYGKNGHGYEADF
ncbi:hypothetical protein [Niabella drilacis]|uniref:Uncharacterized protein n=1 Tax=Niabella drilacis (strain DSM 25811 / CCM 8410 / CCUG 62505 / LMG 26954 / E90) TaxID=1285928 RepID=A0A1G6LFZ3_NIADE|nr:hypothetical protein [Niabella drilacis]SDC42149.1 hypothetical protein SAMN04487894_102336 [Niabella drilacis]